MATALINGRNYSHKDIVFPIGGSPITSLSNLEITDRSVREFSFGTGSEPVGYGDGRDEPVDITFTLSMSDAVALEKASPDQNPNRLSPFDIPITFLNPGKPRLVTIKNVLIMEHSTTSDTDTTDIKTAYTCQASGIKRK